MGLASIEQSLSKYNVANSLEKRSLLIAVNLVAGLSIFFFGYDQGVMGGVNTARDYAQTMGFGHWDAKTGLVVVDKSLLQGGIVRLDGYLPLLNLTDNTRLLCTTSLAHYAAVY